MACQNSIKFKRLKRILRLAHWQVVGVLESLWLLTQTNAPKGDIGRLSDEDIAAGIEWEDDATSLINAFVEAGFLDRSDTYRLVVHDWKEHAPMWLRGALAKNEQSFIGNEDEPTAESAKQPAKHGAKQNGNEPARQDAKQETVLPSVLLPSVPFCSENTECVSPKREVPGTDTAETIPAVLDTEAFRTAWGEWIAYKGRTYKAAGRKSQLNRLSELGVERAVSAIRFSIAQGWKGIFEESKNGNGRSEPKLRGLEGGTRVADTL